MERGWRSLPFQGGPLWLRPTWPANSYPVEQIAPDHDASCAMGLVGAKGAGPILFAAFFSHSPARCLLTLVGFRASASISFLLCSDTLSCRGVIVMAGAYAAAVRVPSGRTPSLT
jgi:hypothetical protein